MIKTLHLRVKDKHIPVLKQWAYEVNQIWNKANELSSELSWVPVAGVGWVNFGTSYHDIQRDTKSYRKERNFEILAQTDQQVVKEHATRRKQFKKNKLQWRNSSGSKRSLGWVPFTNQNIRYKNGQIIINGKHFSVWDCYALSQYQFKSGNFSEDSRGRWYINVAVEYEAKEATNNSAIGIDLGLKDYATCSDGSRLESSQFYRNAEKQTATSQRAKNKKQTRNLNAKVKNRRKDSLHKFSRQIADNNRIVVVGDVSSSKLAKTKMAKSVNDAGWYMLKTFLKYKVIARSGEFKEVNEAYSSRTCSCCGSISGPQGLAGLGVRGWVCPDCGTKHDRDINAAINILTLGLGCQPQVDEVPSMSC